MDKLTVRVYKVGFGDALLVWFPEKTGNGVETKHILIDVGNVLKGEAGDDSPFYQIVADVLEVLDGKPLDLYVMTHEHLDHVQGLPYTAKKAFADDGLKEAFQTRYSWLTASAAPDYYKRFPDARKRRKLFTTAYKGIQRLFQAAPESFPQHLLPMRLNNNPSRTKDCVTYLRGFADATYYVHRGFVFPEGSVPFEEAKLRIWAPEKDTSTYYGRLAPMELGLTPPPPGKRKHTLPDNIPPAGVDVGAFYHLIECRRSFVDNLLAIDKANNNTSVVFSLEWRDWKLLFAGDAEQKSWRKMEEVGALEAVHFLKVSHHGSYNGLPPGKLLDTILPPTPTDGKPRKAVVSTCPGVYGGVPAYDLLNSRLRPRCELVDVVKDAGSDRLYVDITFEAPAPE